MTPLLLERRFLTDYARNGTNLLLLAIVPVTFVLLAAPRLAGYAALMGAAQAGPGVETVTAGWAAGFLTGIAMYFQVASSRAGDRRLVVAGQSRARLAGARLLAGAALAALATGAAVAALGLRQGLDRPVPTIIGTAMFAVVYLAIGAAVGALVPTPVNGTVLLLFVWILDVFFGPAVSGSTSAVLRLLPTHFISLWIVDRPPGHGGPGALAWSVAWVAAALAIAYVIVTVGSAPHRSRADTDRPDQLQVAVLMGLKDWRRTPLLWLLLAAVPAVFILLADVITPPGSTPVLVRENGLQVTQVMDPAVIHSGTMAPEAIASLAALVGVFVVLDARAGDRRLVLAGQRVLVAVASRMILVMLAAVLVSLASLAVTATVFTADQWLVYGLGGVVLALTYGLVGMLLGPVLGRVSGVFLAFLLPFVDLGLGQSPMLGGEPTRWSRWMPGYGGMRVLIDGGLTAGFDETASLAIAVIWLLLLGAAVVLMLMRTLKVQGRHAGAGRLKGRDVVSPH
ncbi:ABC transporter permease [Ornithinimicrobium sp. W1665]|uniref:ABC transporter permease n=1 Tax=Ornithinimicrobium sp. W1665 TaxID=3416666 RepID=UPI003CF46E82